MNPAPSPLFAHPPRKTHHLRDPDHIEAHAQEILASARLGIDTEFVRERTFFPIPGLIQFGDGDQVWLLDPVELQGQPLMSKFLAELMATPATQKILHSVGEDLEVIELLCGTLPDSLFDTQIAAAMLGWPLQVRYETLAHELLGVEFPGGLGRNNWLRRPLPEAWVEYASNDVIALPAMRDELAARLDQVGRRDWFEQDCRSLLTRYAAPVDPTLRISGAARLDDAALARLHGLAQWRDLEARRRDLPRGFVVTDPVLLKLAQNPPGRLQQLEQIKDIKPGFGRRYGARILEILHSPPSDYSRPPELHPLNARQRDQVKQLQALVRQAAEPLAIEPTLIASKRELTRLVQGQPAIDLAGWRGEVLGRDFGR